MRADDQTFFSLEDDLASFYHELDHGGGAALNAAAADVIDDILQNAEWPEIRLLKVDRGMLEQSHEAWVHVTVHKPDHGDPVVRGLGELPRSAVLTWGNSD